MDSVIYERKKLYDEIWTEPVTTVAERYGISVNALKKHCKKLNVPVPPPGYWAKVRAGVKVKKTPLPKSKGQDSIIVKKTSTLEGSSRLKTDRLSNYSEEMRKEIISYCEGIEVPEVLTKPHPLIKDTIQYSKSRKDSTRPDRDNCIDINVSEGQTDRALRIMDTIFKAIEELGFEIKNKFKETKVRIGSEEVRIRLKEKQNRVSHVKTKEEIEAHAKRQYVNVPNYDFIYSGLLNLCIDEWWAPRKNWNDGESKKIESEIGDFIISVIETAEVLRVKREQRQEEERQRREAEILRWEQERLRDKELSRVQLLEEKARNYKSAMLINEYITSLEKKLDEINDEDYKKEVIKYIAWAKDKSDWLNPLINRRDSILGNKYKDIIDNIDRDENI